MLNVTEADFVESTFEVAVTVSVSVSPAIGSIVKRPVDVIVATSFLSTDQVTLVSALSVEFETETSAFNWMSWLSNTSVFGSSPSLSVIVTLLTTTGSATDVVGPVGSDVDVGSVVGPVGPVGSVVGLQPAKPLTPNTRNKAVLNIFKVNFFFILSPKNYFPAVCLCACKRLQQYYKYFI